MTNTTTIARGIVRTRRSSFASLPVAASRIRADDYIRFCRGHHIILSRAPQRRLHLNRTIHSFSNRYLEEIHQEQQQRRWYSWTASLQEGEHGGGIGPVVVTQTKSSDLPPPSRATTETDKEDESDTIAVDKEKFEEFLAERNSSEGRAPPPPKGKKPSRPDPLADMPPHLRIRIHDEEAEQELAKQQSFVEQHYQHANYPEALRVLEEKVLPMVKKEFTERHPTTASTYNNMGLMHMKMGNYNGAKEAFGTAWELYADIIGPDHANVSNVAFNKAQLLMDQVHHEESLQEEERLELVYETIGILKDTVLPIRKAELGPSHAQTLEAQSTYGMALSTLCIYHDLRSSSASDRSNMLDTDDDEQWNLAQEFLEKALEGAISTSKDLPADSKERITSLPKSHLSVESPILTLTAATAAQNCAIFYKSKAVMLKQRLDSSKKKKKKGGHGNGGKQQKKNKKEIPVDILAQYNMTPTTVQQQQRKDENRVKRLLERAEELYQQVLVARMAAHGPKGKKTANQHPDVMTTRYSLAECLEYMGREKEAQLLRNQIVDEYNVEESREEKPVADSNAVEVVEGIGGAFDQSRGGNRP